jgi:hypothetical protein
VLNFLLDFVPEWMAVEVNNAVEAGTLIMTYFEYDWNLNTWQANQLTE